MGAALVQPAAVLMPFEQSVAPDAASAKVSIRVSINFVPASNEDQEARAKERIRRMIYDIAGHECAVLRDAIASDCKLQAVNIFAEARVIRRQQQSEGSTVSGNIDFRIVPKQ